MRMHLASRTQLKAFVEVFKNVNTRAGKMTLASVLMGAVVFSTVFAVFFDTNVPIASADDVTTSVTVLNTPPTWTVNAEEQTASATTTPTNVGDTITWVATANDSSADDYYLLICKTNGTPTPNASAAPDCNGGVSNQWAVSGATASDAEASAATTTIETFPFENESNDWYAWICDDNATLPRCNPTFTQVDDESDKGSPFVVNHPPFFTAIINDSPANPGETVTWTSTSFDTDSLGTSDTVQLFVCREADFTGSACGAGGTWAVSTLAASNAATTTSISIPTQDDDYQAYVYLIDNHGLAATSTLQASSSDFTVSNVSPDISAATIALNDTDDVGNLELLVPASTSGPFTVTFEVSDDNGCQTAAAGDEIASVVANVYRSGIPGGQASCNESGEYDANMCYAYASPFADFSCSQDVGSCTGASDSSATFTCTFSLWYIADPTDASTQYTSENWVASVEASDDDFATSTAVESSTGNELVSFLAFDVTETAIPYGALEPGQNTGTLASTTDLIAIGNVGLDEDLYGDTMCPDTIWSGPDTCDDDGFQAANDITVDNQQFATSSVPYDDAAAVTLTASSSPAELLINVPKTTATSSPSTGITYWGIEIPAAITTAGDYVGQNTITAKKSAPSAW